MYTKGFYSSGPHRLPPQPALHNAMPPPAPNQTSLFGTKVSLRLSISGANIDDKMRSKIDDNIDAVKASTFDAQQIQKWRPHASKRHITSIFFRENCNSRNHIRTTEQQLTSQIDKPLIHNLSNIDVRQQLSKSIQNDIQHSTNMRATTVKDRCKSNNCERSV